MKKDILISFDFDGVVANTIDVLRSVYYDFLEIFDVVEDVSLFDQYNGMRLIDIVSDIRIRNNIKQPENELLDIYNRLLKENLYSVRITEGLISVLDDFKKKRYEMIISSSATKDYVSTILRNNDIEDYFSDIVTANIVERAKPFPDLYLHIKEMYSKYDIIVIEDSDNGIKAAFDAGLKVIFFNEFYRKTKQQSHYEINRMINLTDAIEDLTTKGYFIHEDNIEIHIVNATLPISEGEKELIEDIWNKRPSNVFNGNVLAFHSYEICKERLILNGFITEYKYIYASKKVEYLSNKITTIAVSGISFDRNHDIIALRRNLVTDYSGKYELVPSGGIEGRFVKSNRRGYIEQIIQEFQEELQVDNEEAKNLKIKNLGVCFDINSNDVDICMQIDYSGQFADIKKINVIEYKKEELVIANLDNMIRLMKEEQVVFTSREIIKCFSSA